MRMSPQRYGWQSWSFAGARRIKLPLHNFSPFEASGNLLGDKRILLKRRIPTGWCSWYAYRDTIDEQKILDHVKHIKQLHLPLEYILIDDGWTSWGDWLSPNTKKFPQGFTNLSKQVYAAGFKPGLWIAPFLVSPKAKLCHNHPDWFVRTKSGVLVEGRKITPFDRILPLRRWILDLTLPPVRMYLKEVIRTAVEEWKFTYLKLDYLYAQHFNPCFTDPRVPDQLLHDFLAWIKNTYPHVYIAASGCPLSPAMGVVDAMRISEDTVVPQLKGKYPINALLHSFLLRHLFHNANRRKFMNRFWHLDLDVFVCHPTFGLSKEQIHTLRTLLKDMKGLLFLGDNLLELSPATIQREIVPLFH